MSCFGVSSKAQVQKHTMLECWNKIDREVLKKKKKISGNFLIQFPLVLFHLGGSVSDATRKLSSLLPDSTNPGQLGKG